MPDLDPALLSKGYFQGKSKIYSKMNGQEKVNRKFKQAAYNLSNNQAFLDILEYMEVQRENALLHCVYDPDNRDRWASHAEMYDLFLSQAYEAISFARHGGDVNGNNNT